jgi:hypothetical protein
MEKLKFLYEGERLLVTAPGIIRIQAASNYSRIYFENGILKMQAVATCYYLAISAL